MLNKTAEEKPSLSHPVRPTTTPDQTPAHGGPVQSHDDDSQKEEVELPSKGPEASPEPNSAHIAHTAILAIAHLAPPADSDVESIASPPESEDFSLCVTNTDICRAEHCPEASSFARIYLARRKKEVVDRLMAIVSGLLDLALGPLEEPFDGEGGCSGHCGGSGPLATEAAGFKSLAGQKRGLREDEQNGLPDEDDDENGEDRDRIKKRTKTDSDDNRLKFACPYYKRDPIKFKSCRTCCGPGWAEVHRVKEHVYRRHKLPSFKCNRCYELFREAKLLEEHQRSEAPCRLKNFELPINPIEGYTEEQERKLKSRKQGKKPDTEKWHELYCILFFIDENNATDLPSPYYDPMEDSQVGPHARGEASFKDQYYQYLRRQLPPMVRHELEAQVERELDVVEDRMKSRIIDIVRSLSIKLFKIFKANPPAPDPTALLEGSPSPRADAGSPFPLASFFDQVGNGLSFGMVDPFSTLDISQLADPGSSSLESSANTSTVSDSFYFSHNSDTSVEDGRVEALEDLLTLDAEPVGDEAQWTNTKGKAPV